MSVTILDSGTRLRLKLAKVAETLGDLAARVEDPAQRARLEQKARSIKARAKEL